MVTTTEISTVERRNFSRIGSTLPIPNLIDVQRLGERRSGGKAST